MKKEDFRKLEKFMLGKMSDSSHDCMHIYRVLFAALEIAEDEENVDYDILIAACLLHDVGREQQTQNLALDHAEIGSVMAYDFLMENQWDHERADWVKQCIAGHRYRKGQVLESIEAQILFDADKLDASGALGIARTLVYEGTILEPIYMLDEDGRVLLEGTDAERSSFFQEFNYKLRNVYDRFYTAKAKEMAAGRKKVAMDFYDCFLTEISYLHANGPKKLECILEK